MDVKIIEEINYYLRILKRTREKDGVANRYYKIDSIKTRLLILSEKLSVNHILKLK